MKKIRIFAIISLLLIAVMSLSACSSGVPAAKSFSVVLNKDYVPENEITEKVSEIQELSNARFVEAKGEFMTFMRGEADFGISRIVFSTRNKKVVYIANSDSSQAVEITLFSNVPAFTVTKTSIACADKIDSASSTCELYDAMGNLVATAKSGVKSPIAFAGTVLFDGASYNVNEENGSLTKITDIPENLYVEDCSDWNDKYFYTYGKAVNVYTRGFEHIYSWQAPSWAEMLSCNMLSNGNVLVQYLRPLDNLAEKYDIYEMDADTGEVKKYDIFTYILNPTNESESKIDLQYKVEDITTRQELFRASDDNGMYNDEIDNIAYIYPIKNNQIDASEQSADIVLMSNKGKVQKSLKIVDDQRAALPTCVGKNIYVVPTAFGTALVDIDGNLLNQINNININVSGNNIVSEGSIYTLNMEEVYLLSDNHSSVITTLGGTIFIKQGDSDTNYNIIAVRGDKTVNVMTYDALASQPTYFDELNESGCYAICNVQKGEYLYYSADHKLIHTSNVRLDSVASDFNFGVAIYSTVVDGTITYYAFY